MGTGAARPEEITHCFVLKGFYLAWSMLEGEKVFPENNCDLEPVAIRSKNIENRHGRLAAGWYGVILGKGTRGVVRGEYDRCRSLLPNMTIPPWKCKELKFYSGCVVGVVKIDHSLPYELCKDSPWASGPVCNIISWAGWLNKPIPCRGNLGACPIKEKDVREEVRYSAKCALQGGGVFKTNGETEHPCRGHTAWPLAKRRSTSSKAGIDVQDNGDRGEIVKFLSGRC
tara:strand:+ start:336 stop:1019 length:684 start_codon:yes stop_codon:yes gene_type:complete